MSINTTDPDFKITVDTKNNPQSVTLPFDIDYVREFNIDLSTFTSNTYDLQPSNLGGIIYVTNTGTINLGSPTLPSLSNPYNALVYFLNNGADITFDAPVTIRSDGESLNGGGGDGKKKLTTVGTGVTAIRNANEWWLIGKLSS